MARKVGQIIARGDRRWLIRVYLGRDDETKKRNYYNRTIRSMREAQAYLTKKLRERDLGRDLAVCLANWPGNGTCHPELLASKMRSDTRFRV